MTESHYKSVLYGDPLVRLPVERREQPGQQASFAFPRRSAVIALSAPQPRIEQIPHGIAEHVESVNDNRQAKPRVECQPGRTLHELTPFLAEHPSPARNLEGQPVSEKAQRRLTDNHPPRC